jgi:anti-sigma regulatory factor (Ser/Thr protein kinase)
MEISRNLSIPIVVRSQISEARRIASEMGNALGFSEEEVGKIAIVATELATNLLRHASKGELLIQAFDNKNHRLELIALDHGPGIENFPEAMRDGFSTFGGSGTGLGAIKRLSFEFDVYTQPNHGSAFLASFQFKDKLNPSNGLGVICLPKLNEKVSGDGWSYIVDDSRKLFLVVDGLGHGILAAEASRRAIQSFNQNAHQSPAAILNEIHNALRSTRGAAGAVVELDTKSSVVTYAGIGNISSALINYSESRRMVSHNGTLGHDVYKIVEFRYDIPPNSALVMHSDGLGSQWDIRKYPGLFSHHPSLITAVLYRDFNKERDDITVLFSKLESGSNS